LLFLLEDCRIWGIFRFVSLVLTWLLYYVFSGYNAILKNWFYCYNVDYE
jgi:hypothetical protein